MWRRLIALAALLAGLWVIPSCQALNGGSYLTSLPMLGGAPHGQTEPEPVFDQKSPSE